MPTSYHGYITDVIDLVKMIKPKSILDVGVGFGKWGSLFREYLDIMPGRVFPGDWQIRIDGVEVFKKYLDQYKHLSAIYSRLSLGNICEVAESIDSYDLIFASDVIEHIPKSDVYPLVERLKKKSNEIVFIVPIGVAWAKQGELYGNPNEAHVSVWEPGEFEALGFAFYKMFICNNKPIYIYRWKK